MKLIVGLGNPGNEYENTRHNIGFKVIDAFAHKNNIELKKKKYGGTYYKGKGIIIAKPGTFMNNSGEFVQPLAKFYGVDAEDILVIYDDMDTKTGLARVKLTGSSGGQNGMGDIIERLSTKDIPRLKVGIGRPKNGGKNHVLGKFSPLQIIELDKIKEDLIETIEIFINEGPIKAASFINSK
ncbi:MAG: aminoacyl-tRNA hydrolase [Mycoplasmataceae bacterium]|nr:aminoacyl-tRNA hydrolase [Mycoplasmataceae bacterium]